LTSSVAKLSDTQLEICLKCYTNDTTLSVSFPLKILNLIVHYTNSVGKKRVITMIWNIKSKSFVCVFNIFRRG